MGSYALPLLELDIDALRRVMSGEMEVSDLDIEDDLAILAEKSMSPVQVRLIQLHLEMALKKYKNKLYRDLELEEIHKQIKTLYRREGYSMNPIGEKWTENQLEAKKIIEEVEKIKIGLNISKLNQKLEMAKILASLEMRCEKISKKVTEHVKAASQRLSENDPVGCAHSLYRIQKELARFILASSG